MTNKASLDNIDLGENGYISLSTWATRYAASQEEALALADEITANTVYRSFQVGDEVIMNLSCDDFEASYRVKIVSVDPLRVQRLEMLESGK